MDTTVTDSRGSINQIDVSNQQALLLIQRAQTAKNLSIRVSCCQQNWTHSKTWGHRLLLMASSLVTRQPSMPGFQDVTGIGLYCIFIMHLLAKCQTSLLYHTGPIVII